MDTSRYAAAFLGVFLCCLVLMAIICFWFCFGCGGMFSIFTLLLDSLVTVCVVILTVRTTGTSCCTMVLRTTVTTALYILLLVLLILSAVWHSFRSAHCCWSNNGNHHCDNHNTACTTGIARGEYIFILQRGDG